VVDGQVLVPRAQLRRLGGELAEAVRAVTEARASSDAL
jgi:DNA-directed RNA polymerase specialized sigma24 family protein